jgi:error-prone DNA polymerase
VLGARANQLGTHTSPVNPRHTSHVPYAELAVTSNYTFLTGASQPEELVARAAALGHRAIAITDDQTLGGIVRAHIEAKAHGIQLIVGASLRFTDPEARGLRLLVYATNRASYSCLCRLLTLGKRRAPKGQCHLTLHDLAEHATTGHHEGLLGVAITPRAIGSELTHVLTGLRDVLTGDRLSLGAHRGYTPDDADHLRTLQDLALHLRVPLVATNDVLYHDPDRRALQDVVTCIRHGCTLDEAGTQLGINAERHLKAPAEMARLFASYPAAIARTIEIADRCAGFSLDQLRYEYPDEVVPSGTTPIGHLTALTHAGAHARYPRGVPPKVQAQIQHELKLIDELRFAPYFLTVHDIVAFARGRGILCQGRGAAANSAVCYVLGVTSVDPDRISVLFERFISKERNEPPDIDIDFEHERREEVIQYLYQKYGRERAALTAEIISYRGRSAVREVGKALGLSLDAVDRLAKDMDWWGNSGQLFDAARMKQHGFNPRDPTIHHLASLTRQIMGFPRHRSQHVGGFVISRGPLSEIVPIENAAMDDRTVIEWDKDDLDAMGLLKVDILGLGMLTCIRKGFDLIARHEGSALTLATVPAEDGAVYDMICKADTIGVFQIESRAQMSMLPRLKPRCFYDLVIEVAIVRPGPIQGKMVHPYLRRREGQEPINYPSEEVRAVLGRTLGVPLFQEQAMALSIVAAGFTPGEADQLRRAMAAWKRKGDLIYRFGQKIIDGMLARNYPRDFAERCFEQIKGFSEYGFPESHAASFALLVYVSSWLKCHHPAAFAAALINSQPMGFYAPAQIIRDAREHGVSVLPIDIHHSAWDCTLEPTHAPSTHASQHHATDHHALRLGMRLISGLNETDAHTITRVARTRGPFRTVQELQSVTRVRASSLRRLALADAFGSMGIDRQQALWQVRALHDDDLPLFDQATHESSPYETPEPHTPLALPSFTEPRQVTHDYNTTGLSLRNHPLAFVRGTLEASGVHPAQALADHTHTPRGSRIAVAGLVLVRQRPSTASGVLFITLEDETGIANLIIRPDIYDRFRSVARHSKAILARGKVERQGRVVHLLVDHLADLPNPLVPIAQPSRDFH